MTNVIYHSEDLIPETGAYRAVDHEGRLMDWGQWFTVGAKFGLYPEYAHKNGQCSGWRFEAPGTSVSGSLVYG